MAQSNKRKQPATAPRAARRSIGANDVKIIVQDCLREMGVTTSPADLQQIAKDAAKEAVVETLLALGVDVKDPIATQQMFTGVREVVTTFADKQFQADIAGIRSWRVTMDAVKSRGVLTVVGLAVTAIVVSLWPQMRGIVAK